MKSKPPTHATLLVATVIALSVSACSPKQESSSATAPASQVAVQGEPIKPLAPPQEPAASQATASAVAVASEVAKQDIAQAAVAPAAQVIRSGDQDYLSVGFDRLASYTFEVSDDLLEAKGDAKELAEKTNRQIPEAIRKLNEQTVAVKGYMLPLKVEQGAVTEFLLMRDQSMCCFGTVPKINEWVSVKTIGKGVKPIMDEPVTIFGKLHVGEMRENGYLVGIYRMDGEKLAGPLDL